MALSASTDSSATQRTLSFEAAIAPEQAVLAACGCDSSTTKTGLETCYRECAFPNFVVLSCKPVEGAGREPRRRSLLTHDGGLGGGARGRLNPKRTITAQGSSARWLRREGRRACPEQLNVRRRSLLLRGLYAYQLRRWLELFATAADARDGDADHRMPGQARSGASPRTGSRELHTAAGRLWVLKSEELFFAPDGMARAAERIVQFASNAGPVRRGLSAASGATAGDGLRTSPSVAHSPRAHTTRAAMAPHTRRALESWYAPHNEMLYALLASYGRRFVPWANTSVPVRAPTLETRA